MQKTMLQAGFGREAIMPEGSVHMQGGDWRNRISTGVLDTLLLTCVALRQGKETVLLYTADLKLPTVNFTDDTKAALTAALGIPTEHIFIASTHTHSSVAIRYPWEGVEAYRAMFTEKAIAAARTALADLAEAAIWVGAAQTERMTFVRHYRMNDGTVAGSNFGSWASGIASHVKDADGQLQLVKLAREGKKDILLMSFPAHGTFNEGGTLLSADFPSPMREYVESERELLVAYFIGAAGDQVPSSRIPGLAYSKDYREYGQRLGQYALEGLDGLKPLCGGEVKLLRKTVVAPTNKMRLEKLADAKEALEIAAQYGNRSQELKDALKRLGLSSRHEANWIGIRSRLDDTKDVELKVLSVGELAFAMVPYEMFGGHGKTIKEESPFPMTLIVGCEDGLNYLASEESFDYGCYESLCCFYAKGTAENLRDTYLDMLKTIHA